MQVVDRPSLLDYQLNNSFMDTNQQTISDQMPTTASNSANAQKGIINNNSTDPNKILPMKYKWAREHYKSGVANNWVPEEVSMQQDVELCKKKGTGELP